MIMAINDIIIFSYFLIGFIFIFYCVLTMTQSKINNALRLSLSGLFLAAGFFFTNSAAKVYYEGLSFVKTTLVGSIIMILVATILMGVVRKLNKQNKKLQ